MKARVKKGRSFGSGGRFPAGTVLELTEAEFKGFEDKLERVPEETPMGLVNEIQPDQPVGLVNELGTQVPEELKLMPKEQTADEPAVTTETPLEKPKSRSQRKKATED